MSDTKTTTAVQVHQRLDVPALLHQALANNAGVETLERLFALSKEVRAEQARAAWHEAMAAFQEDVPEVVKSKTAQVVTKSGTRYSYQYAPLQNIISIVRPVLAKHGLSVVFQTRVSDGRVSATCRVGHAAGHVEECEFSVPVDTSSHMNPAQQVASACTYARRYAYLAALGLAPEDDDDAGAEPPAPPIQPPRRASEQAPAQVPPAEPKAGEWTGLLTTVDETTGTNKKTGKPWLKFVAVGENGERYGTFSETIGAELKDALAAHLTVEIHYTDGQYGHTIEGVNVTPF
jgi:hypothetical protein